jgi:alpha-methylacyl-CoA racemase
VERTGPLAGLRVIELAGIGPGPYCAMLLADLGADVLRIDRPGPTLAVAQVGALERGRRLVRLDLKGEGAVEAVLDLVERADVLIEGFRPGVTERLGLGPEHCHERNPGLVYGRVTGWGQDGPLAQSAGHDITYLARTGALHSIGPADGPPQVPLNLLGDFGGGGLMLAFGVLAALHERQGSGSGQVVDAAIVDGVASFMAMPYALLAAGIWRDGRGLNPLDGSAPDYGVYETSDGKWLAIGALEDRFYQELVAGLGLDDLPDRSQPEHRAGIRRRIADRIRERTRDEWVAVFDGTDACVAPVLTMLEAPGDPHLAVRQTYLPVDGVTQPAAAPRFSRTPARAGGQLIAAGGDQLAAVRRDWGCHAN